MTAGSRVGKYRLERLLGRGGMGEVWAGYDPDLDRRVAIKMLRGAIASSPDALARLQREGRAMARLRHANVISVHDATFDGGRGVIAMELIDGENLASWLTREHLLREVVHTVLAAGRGLAAAHAAEMIHRDFKPHNVLVEHGGRVVVTDFGLARAVDMAPLVVDIERPRQDGPETVLSIEGGAVGHAATVTPHGDTGFAATETPHGDTGFAATETPHSDVGSAATQTPPGDAETDGRVASGSAPSGSLDSPLTEEGTLLGTPAYMAPEQLVGQNADARADQFAFCVTAWEALTGIRPFRATTAQELLGSMRRGELVRVRAVPRRWRAILTRGLAFDPVDRWPSMSVLLHRLEHAWNRPRRIAVAGGAMIVVAGVVALFAMRGKAEIPCVDPDDALAQIWSPAIRADLDRQLAGKPMHDQALAFFDRWSTSWRGLSDQSCHERGTSGATALDNCLTSLRDEATLTIAVRARLPAEAFEAHTLEAFVSRPEMCGHNPHLALPPLPAKNRAALEDLRIELINGWVQLLAMKPPEDVIGMVSRARSVGYQPFVAEALIISSAISLVGMGCGPLDEAGEIAESIGHDRLHVHALVGQLACALRRHDSSWMTERLARQAGATAERSGDPVDATIIEVQRARLASWSQRWTEAIDRVVKARAVIDTKDIPALGTSVVAIEASARMWRHHGDDLERADALIRSVGSDDPDVVKVRAQLAWLRGRSIDDVLLPPKDRESTWIDVKVRVRDGGVPVANASVEAGAPSVDRGARVLTAFVRRPIAAVTNADGVASLATLPTAFVIARVGDKQAVAPIAGAHEIVLDLQPAVAVDIDVAWIGPASATDPTADDDRAARRSLVVVGLVGETGAWFAAPVDSSGHAHAVIPAGRYVVAAYARSALGDIYSVQQPITAAAGAPARIALALDPAPHALTVIAKPSRDATVVAFPAARPPETTAELAIALHSAPWISAAEVGPLPRSPDELRVEARDGYAQLTRSAAASLVVCEVADRTLPTGAPPIALVANKPPHCQLVGAADIRIDVR